METASTTLKKYIAAHNDQHGFFLTRMSRKVVSDSFYQHEIEEELREHGISWCFQGDDNEAIISVLGKLNTLRSSEIYPHPDEDCSPACSAKGCQNFSSMDGIWKLRFPHCMYPVKSTVAGFEALNFPNVFTNAPCGKGCAFCKEHCRTAQEGGIPTSLREFLSEYCGLSGRNGEEAGEVAEDAVDIVRMKTRQMTKQEIGQSLASTQQGTMGFISQHTELLSLKDTADVSVHPACNKDTGENQKCLQKWSRGLLHFMRGGGHIESWSPLFVAESPGQVFLLAIHYLYRRLKDIPEDKWEEFILSYDNMCNVCRMNCAREPLPLEPPFDKIWIKITKVIDRLHLRNHKNKHCHEMYSPEKLKESNPGLNTPVAEHIFTWSACFRKILCAMPKERFLFYYHRMVVRRNAYTSKCHHESRLTVLPKVRSKFLT